MPSTVLNGQNVNLNENVKIMKRPMFWNIALNKLSWRKVPQGGVVIQIFRVVPIKMNKMKRKLMEILIKIQLNSKALS